MPSRRRLALLSAATVLLTAAIAGTTAAQDLQKANIIISVSSSVRDGSVSYHGGSGANVLTVGGSSTHYFYTTAAGNGFGAGDKPLEAWQASGGVTARVVGGTVNVAPGNRPPMQFDYCWQVVVKLVSVAIDTVTFDVDWKRTDVRNGSQLAGDHRTLTLHQGEKHLLDFIPCPADARYANTFVDVQASPVEEQGVADLVFDYDLWLVHQTADGAKITRHALATGRQGEKVNFTFVAVPLPLDAAATPGTDSPYKMRVSGTVAARWKTDGTIEVALRPTREQVMPTGGIGFAGGTKNFVSKPGETTSVELPADNGRSSWKTTPGSVPANPRPGVSVTEDSIRIDLKPFFQGASTTILVTVRKQG